MLLTENELFAALTRLVDQIESCGASSELTRASMLANDLRMSVGNDWNTPNEYAAKRVREELQTS